MFEQFSAQWDHTTGVISLGTEPVLLLCLYLPCLSSSMWSSLVLYQTPDVMAICIWSPPYIDLDSQSCLATKVLFPHLKFCWNLFKIGRLLTMATNMYRSGNEKKLEMYFHACTDNSQLLKVLPCQHNLLRYSYYYIQKAIKFSYYLGGYSSNRCSMVHPV